MTKKQQRQSGAKDIPIEPSEKTEWDDAEIVIDIRHTEPETRSTTSSAGNRPEYCSNC